MCRQPIALELNRYAASSPRSKLLTVRVEGAECPDQEVYP